MPAAAIGVKECRNATGIISGNLCILLITSSTTDSGTRRLFSSKRVNHNNINKQTNNKPLVVISTASKNAFPLISSLFPEATPIFDFLKGGVPSLSCLV